MSETKKRSEAEKQEKAVTCCAVGTRCNICGYHFADGDDICSGGGHMIGQSYPASEAKRFSRP